jgi:hypothetical protein
LVNSKDATALLRILSIVQNICFGHVSRQISFDDYNIVDGCIDLLEPSLRIAVSSFSRRPTHCSRGGFSLFVSGFRRFLLNVIPIHLIGGLLRNIRNKSRSTR